MRNNRLFMLACLVSGLCLSLAVEAQAQDTDLGLFSSSSGNAPPNILILVDTSGSMGKPPSGGCAAGGGGGKKKKKDGGGGGGDGDTCTKRTLASQAIIDLVNATNPVDGFGGRVENARLGFAIFTKSGARLMVPLGADNAEDQIVALNADGGDFLKELGGNSHGLAITDMARYLHYPTAWGPLVAWPDVADLEAPDGIQPVPGPIPEVWDAECRQTFLVHVDDGLWGGNDGGLYGDCGDYNGDGSTETCWLEFIEDGAPFKCEKDVWMNDITYKMFNSDFSDSMDGQQPVITHVIGFDIDFPCLEDTGIAGGGTYHTAANGTEFTQALFDVTAHIFDNLTVSFSSATVSSSRTAFSDGFYVAYLVTDSSDPFWEGHLEAYRIAPDGQVLDRLNNPAMDGAGAFIDPRQPYWDVAERLKDPLHPARNIYTTKAGARTGFTTANIVSTDLDIEDADLDQYIEGSPFATHEELADAMVNYLTGRDAFDKDGDADFGETRDKVLGDIFHGNAVLIGPPPIALAAEDGFGPPETAGTFLNSHAERDRRLLVGANDGMLHAIEAGTYQTGDNPITPETEDGYYEMGSGNEDFAWVPGALLPTLKYIPRNQPRRFYYVDGATSAADAWLPSAPGDTTKEGDEWTTVSVTGYRKGGSGYLALDVTDPTAIAGTHGPYPKLLWELDDPNEPFGESWSQMIITRVKVEGSVGSGDHCGPDDGDGDCMEQWVGIIGGGYSSTGDPNLLSYIGDPNSAGWTNEGRGMYIINLEDGSIVSKFTYDQVDPVASQLTDAISSTPAVLDIDFDGFADLVYVGDLGGWLWKWDISTVGTDGIDADSLVDSWRAGPFFSDEGQDLGGGANHWRSVFFPPSATMIDGKLTLSFGSGERTNLQYPGVGGVDENNRFIVITDPNPMGPGSIPAMPYTIADVTDVTATGIDADPTDLGFYISARDGEKFVTDHITFQGFLITTTYAVESGADVCSSGGSSFVYIFDLASGAGFFDTDDSPEASDRSLSLGGGIPSSPAISVGENGATIFVSTSGGSVPSLEGPNEDESPVELVYWKQER